MSHFDPGILTVADRAMAEDIIGSDRIYWPDLCIAPDGTPYLWRWHVLPRNDHANVYFHIQVADDPARPMHDHQYDNQSVILAGSYIETYQHVAHGALLWEPAERTVRAGQVVHRRAEEAHRLRLAPGHDYAITLFTTGPRIRKWGFWLPTGWVPWNEVTEGDYREGGVSKWKDAR
jgi:hypothetical protein